MQHRIFSIVLLSTALIAQGGFVGQQFDNGAINYSDRTIQATGIGAIPDIALTNAAQARRAALRIAKVDAMRNLVEIVNGITVDSETTMSDAMFDDVIKTQVRGMIRGAVQVGDVKYLSDTSIEVTYEVPMSGISEIMTPPAGVAAPMAAGSAPADAVSAPTTGAVTGLIVDARGLGIRPAMSPRLLDQNGGVVYGPKNYTREYAVSNGVAGYSKTVESAQQDQRVVGNPLIIKAVAATGNNKTDVVVGNAEVMKIKSADGSYGILRDCRVLILLD